MTATEKLRRWLEKPIKITRYFGEDYECTRAERLAELVAVNEQNGSEGLDDGEKFELAVMVAFLDGVAFADPRTRRIVDRVLARHRELTVDTVLYGVPYSMTYAEYLSRAGGP